MNIFNIFIEKGFMYKRILLKIRNKIRIRQYVMTLHAEEEMSDDGLTIYDIEHCILTGRIIERQKNGKSSEMKYKIKGKSISGINIEIITKLSLTSKLIIITVYVL